MASKEDIQTKIEALEAAMSSTDFWNDKNTAQAKIKELQDLKNELEGVGKYDKGDAIINIFTGAGGDDAADWSQMLKAMYEKYAAKKGWQVRPMGENMLEVSGKNVYGTLKNESGVHRLVRISPFGKGDKRETSFSMVEVIPKFEKQDEIAIPPDDIRVELSRSSGPGGQNVNKRETAVRVVHIPTNLAVHVETERSQAQNKEKALAMLSAKLYKLRDDERKAKESGMYVSKSTANEWGSQIRSYVLHPYKMVKDHRTEVESSQPDKVLNGDLDEFIEAEKGL